MPNRSGKFAVGRQAQLSLKRAFEISMKGVRARIGRSLITAGGVFLGIAFLSTILTQSLMQWPLPERIEPGYIRVSGQVVNPYDFEAWKPIPVKEGLAAGIPQKVIEKVADGKPEFSLTAVVQGRYQARRADRNLARVLKEWKSLKKFKMVQVYVDAKDGKDMKVTDAIKAGVPKSAAERLATAKTIKGSVLTAEFAKDPKWATPVSALAIEGKDIPLSGIRSLRLRRAYYEEFAKAARGGEVVPLSFIQSQYRDARKACLRKPKTKSAAKLHAAAKKRWSEIRKLGPILALAQAGRGKDIRVSDAVGAGVPQAVARKLALGETLKGADLVNEIKDKPRWVKPIYSFTAQDLDIQTGEAIDAGIPPAIAKQLAGDGKSFKGTALNEEVNVNHPKWARIWRARVKRYAIFKTVPDSAIEVLDGRYAVSLGDLLSESKTPVGAAAQTRMDAQGKAVDSDWTNVMIVNADGRKESVNLARNPAKAEHVKAGENDLVFVPDRNSRFRMVWLVVMSLLVCTVGISNSMLMAVTERFKEIGTLKCLGALDRFVVTLFMIESGVMGIVASVLGWLLGFVIMILIAGASKGWDVVATMGIVDVIRIFVISVGVGLALTIVATIAPAERAARMPAAVALRSEI